MQKLLNEIRKEDYPKNALPQFQSNNKTFNKLTALFPGGQVLLDKSNEYRHEFYKKYCDSAIDLLENIKKQYEIDVSSKILNEKEYRKTLDNIDTNMKNMSTNKEVYDIAISFLKILDDNQESINNKIEDSRKKNRTRYIESL